MVFSLLETLEFKFQRGNLACFNYFKNPRKIVMEIACLNSVKYLQKCLVFLKIVAPLNKDTDNLKDNQPLG